MPLQPVGKHVSQEHPPGRASGPIYSSSVIRAALRPGTIDLESVLPREEYAWAELAARLNPVSTARDDEPRRSAWSESTTERAVQSFVNTESLILRQQEHPLLEKFKSLLPHEEVSTNSERDLDTESYLSDGRKLL